jgi:hypothetical protein
MKDTARKALEWLYNTSAMDTYLGRHTLPVLGYRAIELWLLKTQCRTPTMFFSKPFTFRISKQTISVRGYRQTFALPVLQSPSVTAPVPQLDARSASYGSPISAAMLTSYTMIPKGAHEPLDSA